MLSCNHFIYYFFGERKGQSSSLRIMVFPSDKNIFQRYQQELMKGIERENFKRFDLNPREKRKETASYAAVT